MPLTLTSSLQRFSLLMGEKPGWLAVAAAFLEPKSRPRLGHHEHRRPGDTRRINYTEIRKFQPFEMKFWTGRFRLVGISPGRPRNWFHWDRDRKGKRTAILLDVGRWILPTLAPDDPQTVEAILRKSIR